MENTKENKEKFFAQYWGQEVLFDGIDPDYIEPVNSATIYQVFSNIKRESWLKLTPLSKITDDDAIEVARIIHKDNGFHEGHWERNVENEGIMWLYNKSDYDYSIGFTNGHIECYRDNSQDFYHLIFAFDLLRSKGYALPYMGLSVEKLIEYGWIKLK